MEGPPSVLPGLDSLPPAGTLPASAAGQPGRVGAGGPPSPAAQAKPALLGSPSGPGVHWALRVQGWGAFP